MSDPEQASINDIRTAFDFGLGELALSTARNLTPSWMEIGARLKRIEDHVSKALAEAALLASNFNPTQTDVAAAASRARGAALEAENAAGHFKASEGSQRQEATDARKHTAALVEAARRQEEIAGPMQALADGVRGALEQADAQVNELIVAQQQGLEASDESNTHAAAATEAATAYRDSL